VLRDCTLLLPLNLNVVPRLMLMSETLSVEIYHKEEDNFKLYVETVGVCLHKYYFNI